MADDSSGPGNGLLYGLLIALCAVVIGGGYYAYLYNESLSPFPQTAQAPAPQAVPTTAPAPRDRPENDGRIAALVEVARAAIARHDYGAADRALDEAERIDGRDPTVRRARDELLEAASRPDRRNGQN